MRLCLLLCMLLRRHLKTHSGEKSETSENTQWRTSKNKCNQCDYASSLAGDLRRHLKTYSGEKPKMPPSNWLSDNLRQSSLHPRPFPRKESQLSSKWQKNLVRYVLEFLIFTFPIFLQIWFVSHSNMHFLICWKLVKNLVIGWRLLHWFKSCPQVESLSLPLPQNALLALSVSIELVSLSARVTSVKFQQNVRDKQTEIGTHRSDPRYTWAR